MKRPNPVAHYGATGDHVTSWIALSVACKKGSGLLVVPCIFGVFVFLTAGKASASGALAASERAVLAGVNSGDGTDLGKLPDKSISGDFLSRLLSGEIPGAKFRHNGVQLMNAIIDGNIDISGQDVHVPVTCEHCEFIDAVDLSDVHFFHNVSFRGSSFDQDMNMDHALADADMDLRDVQFDGDVDFSVPASRQALITSRRESWRISPTWS